MSTFGHFHVGQRVWDLLTRSEAVVIGRAYEEGKVNDVNSFGCWGYYLDNDWAGGGRHPWELTAMDEINDPQLDLPLCYL